MTLGGTDRYRDLVDEGAVPPLVAQAVALAQEFDFPYTVHPATGRLLATLAGGTDGGVIGETGTGTGAGVAWMCSAAPSNTRIVSVELDADRAQAAAELFADDPRVIIVHGDANELAAHGPFDLLVLDAPSTPGPLAWEALDPLVQLRPNGVLVKDDLWPMTSWPPTNAEGAVDDLRIRWFDHPALLTTEVTVADGVAVQLARRRP